MIQAEFFKYTLHFKNPSGTSRGVLYTKDTYFLILKENEKTGIGECALFKGLSSDDVTDYEEVLKKLCHAIMQNETDIIADYKSFPSIVFGYEQALFSLCSPDPFVFFESDFSKGRKSIPINGLIWMGDKAFMKKQIVEKIEAGFETIKLKIGSLDFETESALLKYIRTEFSTKDLTLRVDANGAFAPKEALEKLKRLSDYNLHSIEQPIQQGQWDEMAYLCEQTPIPIALDEELIGVCETHIKKQLLQHINPQYIILKPALHGGFSGCDTWIELAENQKVGWWITSALESNIGLNAIAQYTATKDVNLPQGLGTGGLFTNNFHSPLQVSQGMLLISKENKWSLQEVLKKIH